MSYNFYHVVRPLLDALGFDGEDHILVEAIPHLAKTLTLDDLREFMAHLGFTSQVKKNVRFQNLPFHPGILIVKDKLYLVTHSNDIEVELMDLSSKTTMTLPRTHILKGTFCYFLKATQPIGIKESWIREIITRFKPQGFQLISIGCLNALFALTLPLFIRSVFDWAIPTKSTETLNYLLAGLVLALLCHHIVHGFQNKSLAYVGARLNMIIGTSVVTKILRLPYTLVEGASVSEQVSRIKQFDGLKDFFTSPVAQLILEGPFVIFFLIVLGIIAGPIVIIPIVLILFFAILAAIIFPMIRKGTHLSSMTYNHKLSFMLEAFSKINTLKYLGGEAMFSKRFDEKSYNQSKAAENNEVITAYASNLSQILIKIAGIATILWGAVRVMDGDMTVGSLVAVVLLIWRALSPLQAAFLFLSQFDLTMATIRQINQLMALPNENYAPPHVTRPITKGGIYCHNVSFRYPLSSTPSLQGITLEANPGEIVAIIGENASGKSTLIKLLLGFYKPISGSIYLDHLDVTQIPVNHLRHAISAVPQNVQFFHGTVEQNLLLSNSVASQNDIIKACKQAFVWEDICRLPHGLNTKLTDRSISGLNTGFQQKLSLARAYLRDSEVLLLDEPGSNLDFQGDEWFKQTLLAWHGIKTMIIVTHRPSIVNLSDRLLVLSEGKMRYFGPTHKVLEIMKQEGTA
ncbi:MAG: ATP-binding cassette domain-containing protein [Alphaproteobacteria bacterium]|nr:ATP-binding cassette domain-containing protein [Alphaproteobacteria bacterium]